MNAYLKMKTRQQKEFDAFPMFFAFSKKQFAEGMEKLGLKPDDTDQVYSMGGTGGYYRRTDSKALHDMLNRFEQEMEVAVSNDKTGEGFIYDMFSYELSNHEYSYTGDISDTLDSLDLTLDDIKNNPALKIGLKKAMQAQTEQEAV